MDERPGRPLGSIRARIVVGYLALLVVAVVLSGFVVRSALLARLDADVDDRLASEIEQLQTFVAEGDPETDEAFDDAEVLFDTFLRRVLPGEDGAFYTLTDGQPFNLSFDAATNLFVDDPDLVASWAAVERSTFATIDTAAGRARTLVVPVVVGDDEGTFVAVEFTDDGRAALDDVFRTLGIVAVGVLVATGLAAAMVANRVVAPLREFETVVGSITDDDLSGRVAVEGPDEIRRLASRFNAMLDRLETGFVAQRDFLDEAAHELRTPITIVRGHLETADGAVGGETEMLLDELDRMNRYVDDLLLLAQAERPDFVELADVDLDELVDSLFARVVPLADRAWDLVMDDRGERVHLDAQRITQAVLGLVQNAIRHTVPGDRIALGVTCDDAAVEFAVEDSGEGIDPDVADRVFERHVRSASSRTAGGSGLGLSIVDAIATAHGGSVSVDPTTGSGARFVICLPRRGVGP